MRKKILIALGRANKLIRMMLNYFSIISLCKAKYHILKLEQTKSFLISCVDPFLKGVGTSWITDKEIPVSWPGFIQVRF